MSKITYIYKDPKRMWEEDWWGATTIQEELDNLGTYPEMVGLMHKYLPRDRIILESGCGLGKYVIYLRRSGYNIIGIDNCQGAIKKIKRYDIDLPVMVGDVEAQCFKANSFGAVLSLGVFEHFVEGPQKGLKELYRILKTSGILLMTGPYPNLMSALNILNKLRHYRFLRKLFGKEIVLPPKQFFQYEYTLTEIKDILGKSGFSMLEGILWGHEITLYNNFKVLRNKEAGNTSFKKLGNIEKLNMLGKNLGKLAEKYAPFLTAHGWCIVAKKKVENILMRSQ